MATCLKNAGNDRHFSSDVADFCSSDADPPNDGYHLLLQEPLLLGGGRGRKTHSRSAHEMGLVSVSGVSVSGVSEVSGMSKSEIWG